MAHSVDNIAEFLSVDQDDPVPTTTVLRIKDSPKGQRQYNQYIRINDARPFKGRHGEVRLFEKPNGESVAIKVVKRKNTDDKWRKLQASQQSKGSQLRFETMELRVQREIAILKAVQQGRHPNMAQLIEVIDDRKYDKLYIVMEYLSGGHIPFSEHDTNPVLSVEQTRRVIRDVTLGLEYLHYYGIVHCDIKPANLLFSMDNVVKIIDFSVSQVLSSETHRARRSNGPMRFLNDTGLFPPSKDLTPSNGTVSFQAPEIFWYKDDDNADPLNSRGTSYTGTSSMGSMECDLPLSDALPSTRPPVTSAIDVWAMGVTMYCCLFGQLPFTVQGNQHFLRKVIRSRDWVAPPTMGSDQIPTGGRQPTDSNADGYRVIHLLDGMLQKDPARRLKLQEIKENKWLLKDIPKPKKWLAENSVTQSSSASWSNRVGKGLRAIFPGKPKARRATLTS